MGADSINSATSQVRVSLLSELSGHAYNPSTPPPSGLESIPIPATNFNLLHPEIWKDSAGNIIVSFRGTVLADPGDQRADAAITLG